MLISTWSKKVRRREVLKHGNPEDKAKLALPNPKNRKKRGVVKIAGVRRKKGRVLNGGTEHRWWTRKPGRIVRVAMALTGQF